MFAACIAEMVDNRAYVLAHPDQYEDDELEQIDALLEALRTAPVDKDFTQ